MNHMQEKTHCLEATAGLVELRINKDKSTIMKMMTDCLQTVSLTQRWAVIELHVIQLRNSITNYKCNL